MYRFFKRLLDIVLSLLGIIILSPVMLAAAIAVAVSSKGPVLFRQKRVGAKKRVFVMYKFRSMYIDTPENMPTHLLTDADSHITPVGKFLRKTSIDELPQLINILLGHMSVVGPRPALPNQTELLAERDKYGANDIRPGLTGWAQINGRDELCDEEKARYDGEYCRKISFLFDLKCMFKTVGKVASSEGVVEGARVPANEAGETDAPQE